MERVQFSSYDEMLHYNSRVANQFPGVDLNVFRKIHYLELLSQMFGFLFYTFYLIIFLVHGKTFFISEHTFKAIFIIQMITFGAALVIQKFSFMVNSVEYVTYSTFPFIPKFVISICDRLVTAQMPLYWFVVSAFLIIQIAQFANQNPRGIKLAHTYLIPYGIIITLISFITPDHMKLFMIVVCFLIWWIYRKHMIAQLYSQDMTARDVLNMRRMNIWLSSQIFGTLIFHLLDLGMMLAIKSSVTDTGRQTYYGFYKNEVFKVVTWIATYANAFIFAWSTINFIKTDASKEPTTLPVFVNGSLPMDSLSRRPSAISAFSMNNVAPITPRGSNMLHI